MKVAEVGLRIYVGSIVFLCLFLWARLAAGIFQSIPLGWKFVAVCASLLAVVAGVNIGRR